MKSTPPRPRFASVLRLAALLPFLCLALAGVLAAANDPGGGAAGGGANVTLTTTSTTATLNNGVINAVVDKATGRVTSYKLNGTQMVDPANPIYYSMDGGSSYEQPSGCVYSVVTQTADMVEISCKRTWNATAGYKHVFDIDLRWVLRRGDTGLYAYAILDHPAAYPAATVGEWRIVWKLPRSATTFTFERAYVDDLRLNINRAEPEQHANC
jgi:rhamnogalacturonan endolyase